MTETIRSPSAGKPVARTIVDKNKVKKVKLKMNPVTTPSGRAFPISFPANDEDKIIGSNGKMHGESTVTIPAKNAKSMSKIMFEQLFYS
jgi:hypothetical protein